MSTITGPTTTAIRPLGVSTLERLRAVDLAILGFIGIAFVGVYFRWIMRQFGPGGFSFRNVEDWGHSYIVPLISAYFIWQHRKRLASLPVQVFWPGVLLLVLGIACYVYFIVGFSNHMFQGFALILALAGLVALLFGPKLFTALCFPIAYLGFAVTISEQVMLAITFKLKVIASKGSYVLLKMLFVEVDLEGNVLTLYKNGQALPPLNVADACSGMRMVVAFAALATAVAFLSCREWWQRIAVLMLALPVALLMNVIRVAVLGLASLVNPDLSVGEAHTLIGTILLVPALLIFLGGVWVVKRLINEDAPHAAGGGAA